jgi:hypothetical protein
MMMSLVCTPVRVQAAPICRHEEVIVVIAVVIGSVQHRRQSRRVPCVTSLILTATIIETTQLQLR